jgi:uncharacterized protein YyaL (SSP411 family)
MNALIAGSCWVMRLALIAVVVLAGANGLQAQDPAPSGSKEAAPKTEPEGGQSQKTVKHPPNRLAKETSPYLLLHAHNPVDWHPWGPEALAKAKEENKLIFLSIGYSSCYWCHVMERESFMDEEVAAFLNKHFVCIKVDREERPDIDEIYMTALRIYYQVIGSPRGGGWPLSMFLTPEGKPVFGGTYFPPRDRENMDGFLTVLGRVENLWREKRDAVTKSSDQLTEFVRQTLRQAGPAESLPGRGMLDEVQKGLADEYDPQYGGFSFSEQNPNQPKFPEPSNLVFLIDRVRRTKDEQARTMLVNTLEKMGAGGIRDHLGGGFHRYSTDRFWRVPHFEKMLYDNAQLASVYAEAYALTNREEFKSVATEILEFVLRDLTHAEGGFYSAIDAQTDGEEGRYYAWEKAELQRALKPAEFDLFQQIYAVEVPNFEGRFVIVRRQFAQQTDPVRRRERARICQKLLEVRERREMPLIDDKILTAWNALMIRAFADAGRIFRDEEFTTTAVRAADFVLANMRNRQGRLLRTYSGGEARLNAYLSDYAYLVDALIALHQATSDRQWLELADELMQHQIEWFWDDEAGGFFYTSKDHEELIARSKDPVDSARPAGAAVTVSNLAYLARELRRPEYLDRAEKTVRSSAGMMRRSPTAMPRMAVSLAALLDAQKKP